MVDDFNADVVIVKVVSSTSESARMGVIIKGYYERQWLAGWKKLYALPWDDDTKNLIRVLKLNGISKFIITDPYTLVDNLDVNVVEQKTFLDEFMQQLVPQPAKRVNTTKVTIEEFSAAFDKLKHVTVDEIPSRHYISSLRSIIPSFDRTTWATMRSVIDEHMSD